MSDQGQQDMGVQVIDGIKIKIGLRRTHVTTYEDLRLRRPEPVKGNKTSKKENISPSDYNELNYCNRMKIRRNTIKELVYNNFSTKFAVMMTLTFDPQNEKVDPMDLNEVRKEFKKFIQRMNDHYIEFTYVSTHSRQNNGDWHFHVICNLLLDTPANEIMKIWKNGIVNILPLDNELILKNSMNYLIYNMEQSAPELKGRYGYFCSKNLQRDIVLKSWDDKQAEEFNAAFEMVKKAKNEILYGAKHTIGIKGQDINPKTGELFEVKILGAELDPVTEKAGYENWDSTFTHLTSSADFSYKFKYLRPALPKSML